MNERLVPELAAAVLDGKPIDWPSAESSADETTRPVLAELRVLAALADVHRHQPSDDNVLPPAAPDAPTRWGHLRALERIGRGAFGEVYRAWDTRLDREVALKLIDAEPVAGDDDSSSSFIHEGRLLARVRHPNVVTIYGAEQIGARIGLWMEFVRGRTLKQIVDDGKPFSGAEAVRIGIDVARAVAAVHGAGMLHRDIKAQNVMLADDGRAVLMDFGTGREVADDRSDLAGTPLYLAPEILAGGDATVESDIYSLGVLLYYVVTGSYPISAETVSDLRLAHQRNERTPIRTREGRRELSPKLARIIERAIDPRPDGRYASADALAADLAALQRRPALAVPSALAAAAMLLLIAGLGWEVLGSRVGSSRIPSRLLTGTVDVHAAAGPVTPWSRMIAALPFKNLGQWIDDVLDIPAIDNVVDAIPLAIDRMFGLTAVKGQRRYDTNVEAYELYLKGSALVARGDGGRDRGGENLQEAAALFKQILEKDAAFAPAHAGLATAYALMAVSSSTIPFVEAQSNIRTAALAAYRLDHQLADTHVAIGWLSARDLEWPTAVKAFESAIQANPRLTQTYTSYSISTLRPLGKRDYALQLLGVALQHDPGSSTVLREIGQVQIEAGRFEEGIHTLQDLRARDPGFPLVEESLARALVFAGRADAARTLFESMAPGPRGRRNPQLVLAYVALGMRTEAEALAAEFKDGPPSVLAELYTALGDKDRAFDALEQAAFVEPQRLPLLLVSPQLAALRGDARLAALRQRFRLPPQ